MTAKTALSPRTLPLLMSLIAVAAAQAFAFLLNPRFFFSDDRQAQYFPYGLVIRDRLLHGEFPFVTTHTLYGGALWLDWQYGLFNPVSLLMDLLILPQHLELSGLLFALIGGLLLTSGAYALGRAYGLKESGAALLGLLIGLNIYNVYRGAAIWHPGVLSLAWMMFGWAELKNLSGAARRVPIRIFRAAVFIYLMVSAGWPHTDIAFALVAIALLSEARLTDKPWTPRLAAALALGGALCLPVVVPVLAALPWTARDAMPDNPLFHPRFCDLLSASNPLWRPLMTSGTPGAQPVTFAGWFALPVLCLIDWKKIRWTQLAAPVGLAYAFFILADAGVGPALMLRYPIRWISFLHVTGLLSILLMMQQNKLLLTRERLAAAFALLLAPMLVSVALHPAQPWALLAAALVPTLSLAAFTAQKVKSRLPLLLGAGSLVIAMLTFLSFPLNSDAIDWGKRDTTLVAEQAAASVSYTYTDAPEHYIPAGTKDERDFRIAAMGAYYDANTLNGYTSLGQKGFEAALHCARYTFILCAFPAEALLEREPETGAAYADLLKVDDIVAAKQDGVAGRAKKAFKGWAAKDGQLTVSLARKPSPLPGTLSWFSPGMAAGGADAATANGESLRVQNGSKPGLLVFARLYYPGFIAALDGAPLQVRPVNDMLVSVDVPPNASGTVTLSFTPPYLWPCVIIALLSLLAFAGWSAQKPNM